MRRSSRAELMTELDRQSRRTGFVASMHGKAIAERTGLNATDYECIDLLDWTGPISAGELARRVGLTSGAVTGVLDRLERSGLIERGSDPDDRRKVVVRFAEKMQPWAQDMATLFDPLLAEMQVLNERFTDNQLAAIVEWLCEANTILERSTERLRDGA